MLLKICIVWKLNTAKYIKKIYETRSAISSSSLVKFMTQNGKTKEEQAYVWECQTEWINEVVFIYRLSSGQWPDLKAVHSTYHRLTDGLSTWVQQSKDTCSWSISSFNTIFIRAQSFLFFHYHYYQLNVRKSTKYKLSKFGDSSRLQHLKIFVLLCSTHE